MSTVPKIKENETGRRGNGGIRARSASPKTRRATGPRTPEGKLRARYNAVTHGIFAGVVLLDRESEAEFKKLIRLLREDYQPTRHIEEILVAKLAMIIWQQRRLLQAEQNELSRSTVFEELERTDQHVAEAYAWVRSEEARRLGLIHRTDNLFVLTFCVQHLKTLRSGIEVRGFKPEEDRTLLELIFGRGAGLFHPVVFEYEIDQEKSPAAPAVGTESGKENKKDLVARFLESLDLE
ncbi:MAG: hypothetical protein AAB037_03510, partial [Chloroflexota bacterium]